MDEVVLHQWHSVVGHGFFHLGQVHLVDGFAFGQSLHHRGDVERLIALGHVFENERFGNGELGIEGQIGIGGVAEHTTAVVHNLCHLLVGRKRGIRSLVHCAISNGQANDNDGAAQKNFVRLFHKQCFRFEYCVENMML